MSRFEKLALCLLAAILRRLYIAGIGSDGVDKDLDVANEALRIAEGD